MACRRICCASHCAGLGSMHLFPARWTPDTGPDWHWLWLSSIITVHTASFLLVFLPHPRLAPPPASEHQQTSSRLSFHRARHTYLHYWRGAYRPSDLGSGHWALADRKTRQHLETHATNNAILSPTLVLPALEDGCEESRMPHDFRHTLRLDRVDVVVKPSVAAAVASRTTSHSPPASP